MSSLSPGESNPAALPQAHLDIGDAVRDGWAAFRRAPWPLTGFMLLITVLGTALSLLESALTAASVSPGPLLCQLASVVVSLWGLVGLVRGAWSALEGRRPHFTELLRWDGAAIGRLLLASLLLGLILAVVVVPLLALLGLSLDQMLDFDFPLSGPPVLRSFTPSSGSILLFTLSLLALLGLLTYIQVNQHFLAQLTTLGRTGPLSTLALGRRVVDRQWWQVLALLALESLLMLAGALALGLGLIVAVPVVVCISTAAYRQLFVGPPPPAGPPAG